MSIFWCAECQSLRDVDKDGCEEHPEDNMIEICSNCCARLIETVLIKKIKKIKKNEKKTTVKIPRKYHKIVGIRLPDDLHRMLKAKAAMSGISFQELVQKKLEDSIK